MSIIDFHVRIVVKRPSLPFHYYREIQTDIIDDTIVDPAFPTAPVRDFVIEEEAINIPTCVGNSPSDLKIRTNVGSAIVDDDYTVAADSTDKKFIRITLVRDNTSGLLEILAFEKTTDEYGNMPAGKSLEIHMKEFSVVASGTVLVEEQDWI